MNGALDHKTEKMREFAWTIEKILYRSYCTTVRREENACNIGQRTRISPYWIDSGPQSNTLRNAHLFLSGVNPASIVKLKLKRRLLTPILLDEAATQ